MRATVKKYARWLWLLVMHVSCILARHVSVRHETGLFECGTPSEHAPVFVSGNYFQTVRRLMRVLKKYNCYLLVTDSAGINVWCAAGVGDFNEHKIADAINAYELAEVVRHRLLFLPQLGAVGVDADRLYEESGFKLQWGPANLRDLDSFIRNDFHAEEAARAVSLGFVDRLWVAVGMLMSWLMVCGLLGGLVGGLIALTPMSIDLDLVVHGLIICAVSVLATSLYEWIPGKWVTSKVLTFGTVILCANVVWCFMVGDEAVRHIPSYVFINAAVCFFLCADMLGSTVEYKTTIGHWLRTGTNRSLFQPRMTEECTGCGRCMEVCPKRVYTMSDDRVVADLTRECNECLACVRQCGSGAILNRNPGVWKDDIRALPDAVVRSSILGA